MITTTRKLLNLIRDKYESRISIKTGWGKNELMAEYDKAVSEALMEMLDEPQKPITDHPQKLDFINRDDSNNIFNPSFRSLMNFRDDML